MWHRPEPSARQNLYAMAPDPEDLRLSYETIFEEARRALDQQSAALNVLRDRAGTLFSAAAVVGGLLGSIALKDKPAHPITGWGIAGLVTAAVAFAFVCVALVMI